VPKPLHFEALTLQGLAASKTPLFKARTIRPVEVLEYSCKYARITIEYCSFIYCTYNSLKYKQQENFHAIATAREVDNSSLVTLVFYRLVKETIGF
jgi:hypothetical protein